MCFKFRQLLFQSSNCLCTFLSGFWFLSWWKQHVVDRSKILKLSKGAWRWTETSTYPCVRCSVLLMIFHSYCYTPSGTEKIKTTASTWSFLVVCLYCSKILFCKFQVTVLDSNELKMHHTIPQPQFFKTYIGFIIYISLWFSCTILTTFFVSKRSFHF